MSTTLKNTMREVMSLAWQFVRKNGYTLSEALKTAWANIKLRTALSKRVVKFYFQKVDGSLRGLRHSYERENTSNKGREKDK